MQKIVELYKYFSDKRFSTIAGTLVYFLLMSITPFLLWLTLLGGGLDLKTYIPQEIFSVVNPVLQPLKRSAESAAGGAGLILLVTSLYSSANLFYHLRRSGEIIYDSERVKGGIKLRIVSIILVVCVILGFSIIAALLLLGEKLLSGILSSTLSHIIITLFVVFITFCIALTLNLFSCPYKIGLKQALPGCLLTVILWILFAVGFNIYLTFANFTKLYGKIASLIIFLLWCYLMTNSLVIGIIFNSMFMTERRTKKIF